jgi:hypothetical protein
MSVLTCFSDMATVGQAIWFITDLINSQSNTTQAKRSIDEEFAQAEHMITGTDPFHP